MIFEEIEHAVYDQIYVQQNRTTLESEAVKAYLLRNNIEHLAVDTYLIPDGYYSGLHHLGNEIGKYQYKSEVLKRAFNQLVSHANEGGFPFLNSDQNDAMMDALEEQEIFILAELAYDNLNRIAQLKMKSIQNGMK